MSQPAWWLGPRPTPGLPCPSPCLGGMKGSLCSLDLSPTHSDGGPRGLCPPSRTFPPVPDGPPALLSVCFNLSKPGWLFLFFVPFLSGEFQGGGPAKLTCPVAGPGGADKDGLGGEASEAGRGCCVWKGLPSLSPGWSNDAAQPVGAGAPGALTADAGDMLPGGIGGDVCKMADRGHPGRGFLKG